ncbi:MAG: DUF29 family protein [Nitrospinota bacterium]|nr:MAG: DUF29 family protein [Nitrospinota bacterium]
METPAKRARGKEAKSWRNPIRTQREEIEDLLAKNLRLCKEIPDMLPHVYQRVTTGSR